MGLPAERSEESDSNYRHGDLRLPSGETAEVKGSRSTQLVSQELCGDLPGNFQP